MNTGQMQWIIGDRTIATIGDQVLLTKPADTPGVVIGIDPYTGVPIVHITDGPRSGQTIGVWPAQIATITRKS